MPRNPRYSTVSGAGGEHAKQNDGRAYLGRKPSFTREQFVNVRAMLGQQTLGIAQIAKETGLTRQTIYRIKGDPRELRLLWLLGGYDRGPQQSRTLSI